MIRLSCKCGKRWTIRNNTGGERVRCPACRRWVRVPRGRRNGNGKRGRGRKGYNPNRIQPQEDPPRVVGGEFPHVTANLPPLEGKSLGLFRKFVQRLLGG